MTAVYSYDYSRDYYPPIPMVDLSVGLPLDEMVVDLKAIVDSGADATMIPVRHLQQAGARRSRKAIMHGVTDDGTLVDLYPVAIRLGPYLQGFIEVVGVVDGEETIIGRGILNHLSVTLNGPALAVEVLCAVASPEYIRNRVSCANLGSCVYRGLAEITPAHLAEGLQYWAGSQ